jgi:hypothetical protein
MVINLDIPPEKGEIFLGEKHLVKVQADIDHLCFEFSIRLSLKTHEP